MNIAVVGDVILDKYCEVSPRDNPENICPAYTIEGVSVRLGGAANTAMMLKQFGAEVKLFGCVGNDENGFEVKSVLARNHIQHFLITSILPTITKIRYTTDKYLFRVDDDYGCDINGDDRKKITRAISPQLFDAIVISDYAKGFMTKELVNDLKKLNIPIFVDTKPQNIDWYKDCFLIKENMKEFVDIAKSYNYTDVIQSRDVLKSQISDVANILNSLLVITMGSEGIIYADDRNASEVAGIKVDCIDVTGAGDVVLAAIVFKYLETKKIDVAINFANEMAAKSVTQKNTGLRL